MGYLSVWYVALAHSVIAMISFTSILTDLDTITIGEPMTLIFLISFIVSTGTYIYLFVDGKGWLAKGLKEKNLKGVKL